MTTATLPRVRGRKPAAVTHLADVLFDHGLTLDDDALNDRATLEAVDTAFVDGKVTSEEMRHIRRHVLLDAHLTEIGVSLNLQANRIMRRVERLVDEYRARQSREPLESGPQHT